MKRGLIISDIWDIKHASHTSFSLKIQLDRALLKMGLLYWDYINIPDSSFISFTLPDDCSDLLKDGIIQREFIDLGYGMRLMSMGEGSIIDAQAGIEVNGQTINPAQILQDIPIYAFNNLCNNTNTLWSHAISDGSNMNTADNTQHAHCFLFQLHNALPTVDESVNYEQVLKFKDHRRDELSALRQEIDKLYQNAINAVDLQHAQNLAIKQVQSTIADLKKASQEELKSTNSSHISFTFNPHSFTTAAYSTYVLTGSAVASALTGISTCVNINMSNISGKTDLETRNTPYRYAINAHNQLGTPNQNYYF